MTEMIPIELDGEIRVLDLELAEELGFASPIDIRKTVRRHAAALAELGVLATEAKTSGANGGRPAVEYYLNKRQAIFISAKSNTPKAIDATIRVIKKFDAYEKGILGAKGESAPPNFYDAATMHAYLLTFTAEVMTLKAEKAVVVAENAVLAPKAEALDRIATVQEGNMCIQEAAKNLQIRPIDLKRYFLAHKWVYLNKATGRMVAYQPRLNSGVLEHKYEPIISKTTGAERMATQVIVTAKGLAKLALEMKAEPSATKPNGQLPLSL